MTAYHDFVAAKRRRVVSVGFDAPDLHPSLFEHQRLIVGWACRMGRAAVFADTGLGKTRMQVDWARLCAQHAGGNALILAPLAVADQTIREGRKMGADIGWHGEGCAISIINYDKLHTINPADFVAVALDESSILKSYDGATRTAIIEAFSATPYRLACTATPAPNDHTELGNHAEFLGVCTRMEMLAEFFVHDGESSAHSGWRLKGHAVGSFWEWVASWAVMVRSPSDLGVDDDRYDLPPLRIHPVYVDHEVEASDGMLFALPASTLSEQRRVRRDTIDQRIAAAAELASGGEPCIVWCELNDESAGCAAVIDGAVEVSGSDDPDTKRARMVAFADGGARVMVTKPSIAGFGMNWQHCRRMVFVGVSHSYEMFYQAVRRCWRFGQDRPVDVYLVQSRMDGQIARNLQRKAADADRMAASMVAHVRGHQILSVTGRRPGAPPDAGRAVVAPDWLASADHRAGS